MYKIGFTAFLFINILDSILELIVHQLYIF